MKLTIETSDPQLIRTIGAVLSERPLIEAIAASKPKQLSPSKPTAPRVPEVEGKPTVKEVHVDHGRFIGYLRHLPPTSVARVKARRRAKGLTAALELAKVLSKKHREPAPRVYRKRHRKVCAECKKGYLAIRSNSQFCSPRCRHAYANRQKTATARAERVAAAKHEKGTVLVPGDQLRAGTGQPSQM